MKLILFCAALLVTLSLGDDEVEDCFKKKPTPECAEGEKVVWTEDPECFPTPTCRPMHWCEHHWYGDDDDCPIYSYCNDDHHCVCAQGAGEINGKCVSGKAMCEHEDKCDPNAICSYNQKTGITCKCKPLFVGDGFTCKDKCAETVCPVLDCKSTEKMVKSYGTTHGGCCQKYKCVIDCDKIKRPEDPTCGPDEKIYYESAWGDECYGEAKCVHHTYCDAYEGSFPGGGDGCPSDANCGASHCECEDSDKFVMGNECVSRKKYCPFCHRFANCLYTPSTENVSCKCMRGYEGDGGLCKPCSEVPEPEVPKCAPDARPVFKRVEGKCHPEVKCEKVDCENDLPSPNKRCMWGDDVGFLKKLSSVEHCRQACHDNPKCTYYAFWTGHYKGNCELCDSMPTRSTDADKGYKTSTHKYGCEPQPSSESDECDPAPVCREGFKLRTKKGKNGACPKYRCRKIKKKKAEEELAFEEDVGEASGSMLNTNNFYLFLLVVFAGFAGYYMGNSKNPKTVSMLETEMAYGAQLNA